LPPCQPWSAYLRAQPARLGARRVPTPAVNTRPSCKCPWTLWPSRRRRCTRHCTLWRGAISSPPCVPRPSPVLATKAI